MIVESELGIWTHTGMLNLVAFQRFEMMSLRLRNMRIVVMDGEQFLKFLHVCWRSLHLSWASWKMKPEFYLLCLILWSLSK